MSVKKQLVLALLCVATTTWAQRQKIDSLKSQLSIGSDSSQVRTLNELSWHYKNINVDSSLGYARQALALAVGINDNGLIGESLNRLGSAKQALGEYDSALYYLKWSIRTRAVYGDSSLFVSELSNVGIIYDEKGDYELALHYYFAALRMARKKKDARMEANILSNIGVVYKKQKQYEKVLDYYNSALTLYRTLNSDFGVTVTSGNMGSVMLQMGDYEKSIDFSLIAKRGYEQMGYVRYVPYTIGNIAIANDSLHRYGLAEAQYKEAFTSHLTFGNSYEAAYNIKNLAFFYLRQHQPARARQFAEQAIDLSRKIGAKEMLRDSYSAMASTLRALGQFKEAYEYEQEFATLKDSLFEEMKTKSILEMQVKYEAESKELQISNQKVQLATNALDLQRKQNTVLWLASISGLLLVSGALVIQYQRGRRRKSEQEAAFRLKLSEMKLENELQKDRQRISRELHDNIGSRLLFLHSNTESLVEGVSPVTNEKLGQLSAFAKGTLQELRRSVWFINKDYVRLEELQLKMTEYFGFLNPSNQVLHIVWTADPNQAVRSSVAAAVFRVAQEAVSNALRHAQASRIDINISSSVDSIELKVKDDGIGFEAGSVKTADGNGLRNMKTNAESVNGELTITSSEGTQIALWIKRL